MYQSSDFKTQFSFQTRLNESTRILNKYPDKLPLICEKANTNNYLPTITQKKYLVPYFLTIAEFILIIRQKINLQPHVAIFLFVNNQILSGTTFIGHIYENLRDKDGFLYVQYSQENVFG